MFCSGCGQALAPGQVICPQCGRGVAVPLASVPQLQFQLQRYAGRVRVLGIFWLVYAGLILVTGMAGLMFAGAFLAGHFPPWIQGPRGLGGRGPLPPEWIGPMALHFVWVLLIARAGLALAAGWGLLERAQWGRILAVVAALLSLLKFPFGTALGIWTLVLMLGCRNAALYEQL